jgi:hypothetical protein
MLRERVLKAVLVVVGMLFVALIYPMMLFAKQEPALAMMMSLYVTLGIFLLLAARNPSEHRSLIAFTAWSSFVHAILMAGQAFANRSGISAQPPVRSTGSRGWRKESRYAASESASARDGRYRSLCRAEFHRTQP